MAIIKTLDILLRGKTDQLGKDLKRSQSMLRGFSSQVRSIFAAAIPVISFAGLTAGVKSALTELDDLRDRSIRLGIDSGELASLERASQQAGLSINQLSTAQKVLSVQISKANQGGTEQTRIFKQLGISSKVFSQLSPTQQLIKISKALDTVTDRAEKTRIAVTLFGKAGLNVIPLIANGAEDLKRSFEETARLGGIFPDSALDQVSELNDRFNDLKFTLSSQLKGFAIEIAPAVRDIAAALTEALKPASVLGGLFAGISVEVKGILSDVAEITKGLAKVSEALGSNKGFGLGRFLSRFTTQGVPGVSKLASELGLQMSTGWLGFNDQVEAVIPKLKKAKNEMIGLQSASEIKLNLGSAQAGSVAAFETVYSVRMKAPMDQLIQVTQDGNDILGDILDKVGEGNIVDDADILGDLG